VKRACDAAVAPLSVRIGLCRGGCAREGSAERGNDWSFLPVYKLRSKGGVPRAGYPTFNLISGLQRRVWTASRERTLSHPPLASLPPLHAAMKITRRMLRKGQRRSLSGLGEGAVAWLGSRLMISSRRFARVRIDSAGNYRERKRGGQRDEESFIRSRSCRKECYHD